MARIQILELPMQFLGDAGMAPFALVIDQMDSEALRDYNNDLLCTKTEISQAEADNMAKMIGAVGAIATSATINLP